MSFSNLIILIFTFILGGESFHDDYSSDWWQQINLNDSNREYQIITDPYYDNILNGWQINLPVGSLDVIKVTFTALDIEENRWTPGSCYDTVSVHDGAIDTSGRSMSGALIALCGNCFFRVFISRN